MKPPPSDDLDTGAVAGRLDELSVAVRAGRLVPLLKGEGLNRTTIEALLRPESLSSLKAILTDHLFPNPGGPPEGIDATGGSRTWETGPLTVRARRPGWPHPAGKDGRSRPQLSILSGAEVR